MKVGIKILPLPAVLDAQGRAVEQTLKSHGSNVTSCRVGRYVQVEVSADNREQAVSEIKKMMDFVLYNPLIETYEIEVL